MVYGSRMAVAAAVVIMSILSVVVVECADKGVISGPYCVKKSWWDKEYNRNAQRLMDILVDETKNKYRTRDHEEYRYYHSYPNTNLGSVFGGGYCDGHLSRWGCGNCLGSARSKIKSRCDHTFEASVTLADCSLWFRKIVP